MSTNISEIGVRAPLYRYWPLKSHIGWAQANIGPISQGKSNSIYVAKELMAHINSIQSIHAVYCVLYAFIFACRLFIFLLLGLKTVLFKSCLTH